MTSLSLSKRVASLFVLCVFFNSAFAQSPAFKTGNQNYNNQNSSTAPSASISMANEACPGFRTQTQGAYGASASGNNSAALLKNNFATAFPNGVSIGAGTNWIKLTSFAAVQAFLPNSGTPALLPSGTLTNPTSKSYKNTFAGQLTALTISVGLDNALPTFGSSSTNLKDLIVTQSPFFGWTVQNVLDEANNKIAGISTSNISVTDFTNCLNSINTSYDNGVINTSCILICPFQVSTTQTNVGCFGGNNGSIVVSSVSGGIAPYTYSWSNGATTANVSNLSAGTYTLTITDAIGLKYVIIYTITQSASALSVSGTASPADCSNPCAGSVTVNVTGGQAPYLYNWMTSGLSSVPGSQYSNTVNICSGDSSSVTVVDNAGCAASYNFPPMVCFANSSAAGGKTEPTKERTQKVENQETNLSLCIFPNPATNAFRLQFTSSTATAGIVSVYDMEGKLILQQPISIVSGANTLDMNTSQLHTYQRMVFIQVNFDNQVLTKKLSVTR